MIRKRSILQGSSWNLTWIFEFFLLLGKPYIYTLSRSKREEKEQQQQQRQQQQQQQQQQRQQQQQQEPSHLYTCYLKSFINSRVFCLGFATMEDKRDLLRKPWRPRVATM